MSPCAYFVDREGMVVEKMMNLEKLTQKAYASQKINWLSSKREGSNSNEGHKGPSVPNQTELELTTSL